MTILITGGAGFSGLNHIFYHRDKYQEDRVICVDKLVYAGNLFTLVSLLDPSALDQDAAKASRFKFYKVDICDRDAVYGIFEEIYPDVVVNFAVESYVDQSCEDFGGIFLQTNIIGTSVMMDTCWKYGNIRCHQISTDEVYGDF